MCDSTPKSRWQVEYDALPVWVQKMVRALAGSAGYGFGLESHWVSGMASENRAKYDGFHCLLEKDRVIEWHDGFCDMKELAKALTAPWPPPDPPPRQRRAFNIVELAADLDPNDEGGGFDQPCCFGNRVGYHATYCHNEAWPDSPRKCRRNRDDYRHEDCPGFVANPDFVSDSST